RRHTAQPAVRGPHGACRGVRPLRLSCLPSGRAPRHAVGTGAFARLVHGRAGAADETTALRTAGLSAAALPPAAPDRGNLHARSYERRSSRAGRGARRLADRGWFLRRGSSAGATAVSPSPPCDRAGPHLGPSAFPGLIPWRA